MRTRFTYLGATTIECVVDGDAVQWNILPAAPGPAPLATEAATTAPPLAPLRETVVAAPPEPDEIGPESALAVASLPEDKEPETPIPAKPVRKAGERVVMATIRSSWFVIFTGTGAAVDFALANLTALPVPPGTGTAVGAGLSFAKRAFWPDTKF